MNRLEALLYCLFFVLALFCYKSLIPAPMSHSETKKSEKIDVKKQFTKQELTDLSKKKFIDEMKALLCLTGVMTTFSFVVSSFNPYLGAKGALCSSLVSGLALFFLKLDDLWWDHCDRVEFGITSEI